MEYENIHVPNLSTPVPEHLPKEFVEMRHAYPIFLLVNGDDWENAKKNRNLQMRFAVMNHTVDNGTIVRKPTMHNTVDNIENWTRSKLPSVINGPPLLKKKAKEVSGESSISKKTAEETVEEKRPFGIYDSMFVPTCNRNANIVPSVQNGGYAPF